MTKFAALFAAAVTAATLVGAPAAKAGPYQHEHLVEAIVSNRIEQAFGHRDQQARVIRAAYLAGFSFWYDSRCDFLPMPTFEAIKAIVEKANRDNDSTHEAVRIGLADAKAFLGEQGCATRDAGAARASLSAFWQNTMQLIQNGRPRPDASPRRDLPVDWSAERGRM